MPQSFDPYLVWLSIRDPQRPPNHYRLLGVELFEADPEVLAHAAKRQLNYLQSLRDSEHAADAEQLAAELVAAAQCLGNAEAKAVYDSQLRAMEASRHSGLSPISAQEAPIFFSTRSLPRNRAFARRRSPRNWLVIVLIGGVIVSLGGLYGVIQWKAGQRRPVAVIPLDRPITPPTAAEKEEARQFAAAARAAREAEKSQSREATPEEVAVPKKPADASPEPRPDIGSPPSSDPPPRRPIPSEEAQQRSRQEIQTVFADRYAAARERDDKRSLARVLFQQAIETRDDWTVRFMLMSEARDLALAAVDSRLFIEVMARMGEEYELNWRAMATDLLIKAAGAPRDVVGNQSFARLMLELARGAMQQEQYAEAGQLLRKGREVAQTAHDEPAVKQFQAATADLDDRIQLKLQFLAAEKVLAKDPDDAQANQLAGRYYCRVKEDWPRGMKLLEKGGEAALQKPLEAELAAGPRTTADMLALADLWYEAAKKVTADNRRLARMRTIYWYEQALPALTGFTRKKVERQLEELGE